MKTKRLFALLQRVIPAVIGLSMMGLISAQTSNRSSSTRMDEFIRLFEADNRGIESFYQMPWSEVAFDRVEQMVRDWQQRLRAIDFDALDLQGRIDYLLLRNELGSELARLTRERGRLGEMKELLPFRESIQKLEQARWKMESLNSQQAAAAIAGLPGEIKKLRERIEKARKAKETKEVKASEPSAEKSSSLDSPSKDSTKSDKVAPLEVSPLLAKRTAEAISAIRDTLKNWFSAYDGFQPDFSWWLRKPHEDASAALEEFAKFLREEIAGLKGKDEDPLLGEPIGATKLASNLEAEMIPYSPAELINIGEREFAWCEDEMKKAAKEMGFDDWKQALTKVKSEFVPPGGQEELVSRFARESVQFLKAHDLVTVPPLCEELWRISMISPQTQKTLPYAAYGGQTVLVAYAKDEMKHEDKVMSMRGNNRHFTRIVTAHELIPGHHLQAFMSARNNVHRSRFSTPFYVEGWSLHWEMLLWDLGYAQTPEDRIGMLFWRMHRAARIIVSLKFHLGQMQPLEMVDFLVDRVGHERMGATSEVRRFIGDAYSPLYQCGYMIGGLQLRALHSELVGAGKMTEKQFHDTVLTYGPIPVELIRAGMLNLSLNSSTRAAWRFAP